MTIIKGLQDYFIDLAPSSLQSLTFMEGDSEQLSHLRRLSNLTRLELDNVSCNIHMELVHKLGIVELVLCGIFDVELILVPGALQKLQRLHIEDCSLKSGQQQVIERVNNVIFGLPNLCQVSGASCLFEAAQHCQLQLWERSQSRFLPCFPTYEYAPFEEKSVWKKPRDIPRIE